MSLYRKYRPQTFEDVVGQEHIADTLRNALSTTPIRVAHAYLFCGPRGTGKTTAARLLAKCLNCEQGPTPTPCNQCDFCVRVSSNQATMDLIELDAASNRSINDAREIISGVNVAPAQGRYRVYIIDEVHMLTTEAFNALLKTLEEPPAHAIFILATTDAHKVPVTISSRCQRFDFRRVGPQDIVRRLQHVASRENMTLSEEAARLIATSADGALRDALTLLEQVAAFAPETIAESDVRLVLGTVSRELLDALMESVAARDAMAAIAAIEKSAEEGVSFSQVTRDLVSLGRDLLLLTVGYQSGAALTEGEKKWRHDLSQNMGRARLTQFVEAMRGAEKEMRTNTDHRLLLELTLVQQTAEIAPPANVNFTPQAPQSRATPNGEYSREASAAPRRETPPQTAPLQNAAPPISPHATNGSAPHAEETRAASTSDDASTRTASNVEGATSDNEIPLKNGASPQISGGENALQDDARLASTRKASDDGATSATQNTADESAPREYSQVAHSQVAQNGDAPQTALAENIASIENAASPDEAPPEREISAAKTPKKAGRRIHDLAEFQELWPFVLARVRKKIGVTAVAYLHDARPVALDDKEAVLEFQKEFHFEKACEAAKRLPFEQVVNECMAAPHVLRMRLYEPPSPGSAALPEPEPAPPDDDEDDDEDIVQFAQNMFGGEVVGRSGAG